MIRRGASRRSGYTLLEILIAASLATAVAISAGIAAQQSYDAYRGANVSSAAEAKVRQAAQRVSLELIVSGIDVIFPQDIDDEFGTSDLVFQQAVGVQNEAIVWGPAMRLVLEYDRAEVDDGLDNDGDGLIDEGSLVLVRNDGVLGETRTVLCHDVREFLEGEDENGADDNGNGIRDERGFNVHRNGDVLTVRLSVEQTGEQPEPIVRTLSTSVRPRN